MFAHTHASQLIASLGREHIYMPFYKVISYIFYHLCTHASPTCKGSALISVVYECSCKLPVRMSTSKCSSGRVKMGVPVDRARMQRLIRKSNTLEYKFQKQDTELLCLLRNAHKRGKSTLPEHENVDRIDIICTLALPMHTMASRH